MDHYILRPRLRPYPNTEEWFKAHNYGFIERELGGELSRHTLVEFHHLWLDSIRVEMGQAVARQEEARAQ